jgi:hypothetical protein
MTKRIYWSDIIECEDQLFESLDALIAVATETPECFISDWGGDDEIISVEVEDNLIIKYSRLAEYDENDNPVSETKTEEFSYDYGKELAVLVP